MSESRAKPLHMDCDCPCDMCAVDSERHCGKAQCNIVTVDWDEALDAAIQRIATGRTAVNFGHIPEVVRALEWVIEEVRELKNPEVEK